MGQTVIRLRSMWDGLTPVRKGLLTAAVVGLFAVVGLGLSWSGRTQYATIYSGLDPADSGAIVEQLRSQGVPYELADGGTAIRVPQAKVDELRVGFASQGLPQGGNVGFEIFQGGQFTATDFVQRLNFQRGLQGELTRTIESFPAVERARVHIVMPEHSLFIREQQPATASVVVSLRPGRRLQPNEVSGIAHLVSGAVEGLSKEHITVLDQTGAVIYDGAQQSGDGFGLTATQMGLQEQFQQSLERDAQSMLDRTLGPSKSTVSVRAALNFDRTETERETFQTPQNGAPRSSSTVTETYTAAGANNAGQVPGALANVPGANANLGANTTGAAAGSENSNYQRQESTSNFELDRTKTKQQSAPGKVERLTVSLIVDESIPQERVDALKANVAAAVGLDEKRGDVIAVSRMTFDRTSIEQAQSALASEALMQRITGIVRLLLPLIVLVVGFIVVKKLIASLGGAPRVVAYDADQPMYPALAGMSTGNLADATAAIRQISMPEPEIRKSDLELSVARLATSHPDTVAEVVQSWLRED